MSGTEIVIVIGLLAAAAAAVIFLAPKAAGIGAERQDLDVSDSAFGNFIPIGRGRFRVSGDLVYARELIVEEESSGGGKGGAPSQKTFSYFLDGIYIMADASIFGPAKQIVKVWADTELIFDITGLEELDVKEDVTLRFKLGDAVQEPDIMQTEDEGTLAQGFPFSVLIALDRFPLKYTGDRPPSISAEIDFEEIAPFNFGLYLKAPDTGTIFPNETGEILFDTNNRKIFHSEIGFATWILYVEYDMDTLEQVQIHDVTGNLTGAVQFYGIDPDSGFLVGTHNYDPPPPSSENFNIEAYVYDPKDKVFVTDVNFTDSNIQQALGQNELPIPVLISSNRLFKAILTTDGVSIDDPDLLNNVHSFPELVFIQSFLTPEPALDIWRAGAFTSNRGSDTTYLLWKTTNNDDIQYFSYKLENTGTVTSTPLGVLNRTAFHASKVFAIGASQPLIDLDDNTIIAQIFIEDDGGGNDETIWFKYDPDTNTILWTSTSIDTGLPVTTNTSNIRIAGGTFIFVDESNDVWEMNTVTGVIGSFSLDPQFLISFIGDDTHWDGVTGSFYGYDDQGAGGNIQWQRTGFIQDNNSTVLLADIIREICVRVGLVESVDFDVSAVTGSVWGWKIGSRIKANEALGEVMQPFFLQAGTQDGMIKFITRNETSIDTVSIGEFVQDSEDDETLPYTITEEDEASLPSEVNVGYDDHARDYEAGNASYRRPIFPDLPIQSFEKLDISTPFVLTAAQGKSIAYTWTYIPWLERDTIKGILDWTHISYVGNDIITFDFGSGVLKKARVKKASIRNDWTIDLEAVFIELGASSAATFNASAGDFDRVSSIEPTPDTTQHILDINLLRDQDDLLQLASLGYTTVGPKNPPNTAWIGATIHRSYDQVGYEQITNTPFAGIFGATNELLTTPVDPFGTKFDDTLDVLIPSGKGTELSNITYQALLNEGNPFVIIKATGHEICQFQNVTNLGGNIFRLSILGRGKRGTDTQVGGNTLGDLVIFPNTVNMERFSTLLTNIGDTSFFRAVSSGQQFNDANDLIKIMTGNDLKPYAPTNFVAFREVNDDLTITFNRRTRVGAGIVNGEWRSPINEAISSFEVDTYDATGVTFKRTIASSTESFTYTSANQTTDGLSLSATTVWIEIFQLSDIVGRGYSYKLQTLVTS